MESNGLPCHNAKHAGMHANVALSHNLNIDSNSTDKLVIIF